MKYLFDVMKELTLLEKIFVIFIGFLMISFGIFLTYYLFVVRLGLSLYIYLYIVGGVIGLITLLEWIDYQERKHKDNDNDNQDCK